MHLRPIINTFGPFCKEKSCGKCDVERKQTALSIHYGLQRGRDSRTDLRGCFVELERTDKRGEDGLELVDGCACPIFRSARAGPKCESRGAAENVCDGCPCAEPNRRAGLTETIPDAIARPVTKGHQPTPSVRKLRRRRNASRHDPSLRVELGGARTPHGRVDVHCGERDVEDLSRSRR